MQKLMLTLLTYEPYEKVSQAEKEYIDGVLNEQPVNENSDYHQLFYRFYLYLVLHCENNGESITCYQRPLHACEARRRRHYAVASQTHR